MHYFTRGTLLLLLIMAPALLTATAPIGKTPPPDAAAQDRARATVRAVFKDDYAKAEKDAGARRDLAARLLRDGKQIRDDVVLRFVTLREAYDLAVAAEDLPGALEAAAELAREYAVDGLRLRIDAVLRGGGPAKAPEAARALARAALDVADDAVGADDLESARRLLDAAVVTSSRGENPALKARADRERKHLEWRLEELNRARQALEAVRKGAGDAAAHLAAGRYLAAVRGRWDEGLPLLAKGEGAWKAQAARDLAKPTGGVERAAVGDGWWDLATGEAGAARAQVQRRAYSWYRQALDDLEGPAKERVQARLDEITETVPYLIVGEIRKLRETGPPVPAVAVSPDGKHAYCAGWDRLVRRVEVVTGKEAGKFAGHTEEVWAVAVSPDGRRVLSGGKDHTVRLWDVATQKEVLRLEGHTDQVRAVAFSPDGRQAATGGEDHTVRLWDLQTGKQLHSWEGHTRSVEGVAFTPDGKQLLSASWDRTLRLWDVASRKELRRMRGHKDGIYRVVLSVDGRHALTASADKTLRLWDLETGQEVRRFEGHGDHVLAAALSPDGQRAVSGGGEDDRTVRLWDVETGKELHRFSGHTKGVWGAAFLPGGWRVVSSGEDGTVRLWGLPR